MMRHLRLLGLICIAMLALFAAPTVVGAQTPVQNQYQVPPPAGAQNPAGTQQLPPDAGDAPADDDAAPADDDAAPTADAGDRVPVAAQQGDAGGKLPFTGGSVPLVAMIGLGLLAAGLAVGAATRKRRASGAP